MYPQVVLCMDLSRRSLDLIWLPGAIRPLDTRFLVILITMFCQYLRWVNSNLVLVLMVRWVISGFLPKASNKPWIHLSLLLSWRQRGSQGDRPKKHKQFFFLFELQQFNDKYDVDERWATPSLLQAERKRARNRVAASKCRLFWPQTFSKELTSYG